MNINNNELFQNRSCNECNSSDNVEIIKIGANGIALCMECRNKLRGILGIEQKPIGIELRNIDLIGISIEQQTQKAIEEDNELIEAIAKRDKDNAIEEFWDCVQVRLGALQIALGITAQEVMEAYTKHLEKLKNRPRKKDVKNENR